MAIWLLPMRLLTSYGALQLLSWRTAPSTDICRFLQVEAVGRPSVVSSPTPWPLTIVQFRDITSRPFAARTPDPAREVRGLRTRLRLRTVPRPCLQLSSHRSMVAPKLDNPRSALGQSGHSSVVELGLLCASCWSLSAALVDPEGRHPLRKFGAR